MARVISVLLVFWAACRPPSTEVPGADRTRTEEEIREAVNVQLDGCSALDEVRCFGPFMEDALIVHNTDVMRLEGFEQGWKARHAATRSQSFVNRQIDVHVMSPTVAVAAFKAGYFRTDTLGVSTDTVPIAGSQVWQKEGSAWRAVAFSQCLPSVGGTPGENP